MQDVIKKLSTEQALEVVKRLSGRGGKIQEAVLAEARDVLSEIELDETSDGPELGEAGVHREDARSSQVTQAAAEPRATAGPDVSA